MQCQTAHDLLGGPIYSVDDTAFTASSEFDDGDYYYCAACSRLDGYPGWASMDPVTGGWISVDLGAELRLINAVKIRSSYYDEDEEYVTQFTLATGICNVVIVWALI